MFNATLTEQRYEPQPHICWDPCWPPHAFGTFVNTVVSDVEKKTRDATCFLGVSSPLPTRWKPHASQLGYRQLFRNHQLDWSFWTPKTIQSLLFPLKSLKNSMLSRGPHVGEIDKPILGTEIQSRYCAKKSLNSRRCERDLFSSKPASSSADLPQTPAAKFPLVTIQRQGPLPRTHASSEGTHWTPPSRSC
jgi:hypothetical protein